MLRFACIGAVTFGAVTLSQKALSAKTNASRRKNGSNSPVDILLKSFGCIKDGLGPWSMKDMTLGLMALFMLSEKDPPKPPGKEAKERSQDKSFLLESQHWLAHAEAAYSTNPSMWSLQMNIPENAILAAKWSSDTDSMRPSYVLSIDSKYDAIVLSVRGTNDVTDMLLSSSTEPVEFHGGKAHAGFVHGKEAVLNEIEMHIKNGMKEVKHEMGLVLVGHSLGCAITTMLAFHLRNDFPNLKTFGYGPPACMSLELAQECKKFATCFLSGHDLVPRFSVANVERLRHRVLTLDWTTLRERYGNDKDWESIWKGNEIIQKFTDAHKVVCNKIDESRQLMGNQEENNRSENDDLSGKAPHRIHESDEHEETMRVKETSNHSQEESLQNKKANLVHLYPPGRIFLLDSNPPGCGKHPNKNPDAPSIRNYGTYPNYDESKGTVWTLFEVEQEELENIIVSPWCVSDHMPGMVLVGLEHLARNCSPPP